MLRSRCRISGPKQEADGLFIPLPKEKAVWDLLPFSPSTKPKLLRARGIAGAKGGIAAHGPRKTSASGTKISVARAVEISRRHRTNLLLRQLNAAADRVTSEELVVQAIKQHRAVVSNGPILSFTPETALASAISSRCPGARDQCVCRFMLSGPAG